MMLQFVLELEFTFTSYYYLCAHQQHKSKSYIFNILRLQLVSFSHCTSSNVRVDNVTRLTIVSHIGQGNVLRLDNSLSTQEVQLF